MNSVHEPGSQTMSKNLTPEKYQVKPGKKQAECTECTVCYPSNTPDRAPLPRSYALVAPRPCPTHPPPPCASARARAPSACVSRARLRRARARLRPPARPCRAACPALRASAYAPLLHACASPCAQPKLKWAVAHFRFCIYIFFFSFIFFLCYWKITQKYIFAFPFFFHFLVPPNKFIKIYFILFFFLGLHTIKILENFFTSFFFLIFQ